MAIITDATGRQLAQAVGGIDTGGLAKDTTLQATNSALGNINTTEQAIASAISGLGQTLGSDKANIDGSNIVNPSAFRSAIGLKEAFVTEQHFLPNALTIPPDSGFNISFNIAKSGYTPLAVASWSLEQRGANVVITGIRFNGSSVQILGKSYASDDIIISTTCNVNILYIKD